MTYREILSHSLPFLHAFCGQINRIRIIEAGGDPDRSYDENEGDTPYYRNNDEVESTLSDAEFYGQLNALLR